GTAANALDVAGGINAGSGNVGIVDATGKIPALSATYLADVSGANLTSLSAANLSGAIPQTVTVFTNADCETLTPVAVAQFCYSTGTNILNVSTSTANGGYAPLH
ncbi:MAG: hypothetical protein Q8O90_09785, partial [Elusimicrobiota bacterium]|nr:hypothetical protein [Elusimicrobiota bacterium]